MGDSDPNQRPTEKLKQRKIRFLQEQDGEAERDLKSSLSILFQKLGSVRQAYLVRVAYGDSAFHNVALCLRSDDGAEVIVREVSSIFSAMFGGHEHLDIMFLSHEQETEILNICRPFFNLATSN